MSKSKYVNGIRFFPKKDGQPWNGVITPNRLFEQLKSGEADDAKGEYNGDTQFKITAWANDDNSLSLTFNTYQPDQKPVEKTAESDDLPF